MLEKVIAIVREQGCFDEDMDITPATRLEDDLRLDSLDLVEILTSLEDEFDIELSDEEDYRTVADLIAAVEENL